MMGARVHAMPQRPIQPVQRQRTRATAFSLVISSLTLVGCNSSDGLPNVLYLAIATSRDQTIDGELLQESRRRIGLLETGFRQLHPSTHFQFSLYPRERIEAVMHRRTRAGLGPDLLLVNGETAVQLLNQGLTDPFPATAEQLKPFPSQEIERLRDSKGRLAGIPLAVQSQLACFNSRRLPKPPDSIQTLLSVSANGSPIGLSIELTDLIWSAGSLGALEGLIQAAAGQIPTASARQGIDRWLAWLQQANAVQKVTFYPNYESAEVDFLAGRLDWIPCPSTALPRLSKHLGAALGICNLPKGNWGDASPLNQVRMLALGKSSSRAGRKRALAFSHFSINPLSQRNFCICSQVALPANRFVGVPVNSSPALRAMAIAIRHGQRTNILSRLLQNNRARINKTQTQITELVFGEDNPVSTGNQLVHILRGQP